MGQNQTAKGMLRFEKDKGSAALPGGLIRVKVSGVLKAEGAIVGNFVKDGRYTVTGEQHYDPKSREWKKASWSVDVANELANAAGVTVAQAKGKMMVDSKMLGECRRRLRAKGIRSREALISSLKLGAGSVSTVDLRVYFLDRVHRKAAQVTPAL